MQPKTLRRIERVKEQLYGKPDMLGIVACKLHEYDLYQAGFMPGHGELTIVNEDITGRLPIPFAPINSLYGSPGAMCVG